MKIKTFFLLLIGIATLSCAQTNNKSMMEQLTFEGRVKVEQSQAELYWPGTSVSFQLEGKYLDLELSDDIGESEYALIIDGEEQDAIIRPAVERSTLRVWESDQKETHTFTIHRRNDFSKGTTTIYNIITDGTLQKTQPKKKWIEFYGNSITVGYANEDQTGTDNPLYTNNYKAFSALTARHFDASLSCIAKSGIGITVSWFDLIMPELYDRFNPNDPTSKWDFHQKTPDLVVVNLLQNDSWLYLNRDNENYRKRIGNLVPNKEFIIEHYISFLQKLKGKYPNTSIICALGCMDIVKEGSPWPEYVTEAIRRMDDPKLYFLRMPYLAKTAHPSAEMHQEMADSLAHFIEKKDLL
ncbi:SGNH/GDSL hydrolase family protein [Flammeovirga aprica]|uniref:Electron transporter RnfD n=1 Tax=Flammeovirga aprica JL-4 TaxID=694437 RepID=A0A7X9P1S1_9BACT|nr:electron transporter RnfD [Flammeovirga aprica]NME67959.1 electron transporter RnfD [Flammeovirga aprica JL-4]